MSDIVERLRNHVNHRGGPTIENSAWQMMLEAAAEIEKLRERLEKAHSFISRADWMQFFQEEQEPAAALKETGDE